MGTWQVEQIAIGRHSHQYLRGLSTVVELTDEFLAAALRAGDETEDSTGNAGALRGR